jgi:hypothetical protein
MKDDGERVDMVGQWHLGVVITVEVGRRIITIGVEAVAEAAAIDEAAAILIYWLLVCNPSSAIFVDGSLSAAGKVGDSCWFVAVALSVKALSAAAAAGGSSETKTSRGGDHRLTIGWRLSRVIVSFSFLPHKQLALLLRVPTVFPYARSTLFAPPFSSIVAKAAAAAVATAMAAA